MADSSGSTIPRTEKGLPTGTMPLHRDTTGALHQKPLNHVRHFEDVPSRGGRISPGAEPTSSKDARLPEGVIFPASVAVPFQAWTAEAVRLVTSAAGEVPAAKACRRAAEGSEAVPVAVASVAAVVAAAEGGKHAESRVNNKYMR